MNLPRFTAEASLPEATKRYLGLGPDAADKQPTVIPQFCYCDCRLIRYCIPRPPYGIPVCFYRQLCIPRGNCPPGYCARG
jgi:hypothetical protein